MVSEAGTEQSLRRFTKLVRKVSDAGERTMPND